MSNACSYFANIPDRCKRNKQKLDENFQLMLVYARCSIHIRSTASVFSSPVLEHLLV
jgi:hypothetical protein